jgi:hypothetical protein
LPTFGRPDRSEFPALLARAKVCSSADSRQRALERCTDRRFVRYNILLGEIDLHFEQD